MSRHRYTENPSVHIDLYGNPHLNIFLHFFYEKDLPKYQVKPSSDEMSDVKSLVESTSDNIIVTSVSHQSEITSSEWGYTRALENRMNENLDRRKGFFKKLFYGLCDKFRKGTPVEKVFEEAKKNFKLPTTEELESARKSAELLEKFLKDSGQIKQAEKVHIYKEILSGEIILMKNGIDKYLLEEDVIEFMLKSEKGVFIDFLRNFSNILPINVAKKKIDIDKLLVFDNYAVMYYDKSIDPFREIKDEEVKRKEADPILFGLISGSNKLYYITDWIYEDDDLTMEKVEMAIGRKARQIQNAKIAGTEYELHNFIMNLETDIRNVYEVSKDQKESENNEERQGS